MAWIESHDELPTHTKTLKVSRRLGITPPHTIGLLHCLWYWCLTHRPEGRLTDMDGEDIATVAGWGGDGDEFVGALLAAGWLDDDDGTMVVHDWWEHAGQTIARRKKATTEQRESGRVGAHRRWCLKENKPIPNCPICGTDIGDTKDPDGPHDGVPHGDPMGSDADRDRDRDRDKQLPPGGNDDPFEKKLADELRADHGCTFGQYDTLQDAFQELLTEALERLPEDRHHKTSMGLIARFVERTTGQPITREARSHTGRLINNHRPTTVLRAFGEAMDWGAGTTPQYADDPTALSKYVAGVLSSGKRGAA